MLETSPKHVVCGAIMDNNEVTELYCHLETGDVAYTSCIDGCNMLIGEITVDDPLYLTDIKNIKKGLYNNQYADAIGLILCKSKVIAIMPNETAEIRTLVSASEHSSDIIQIDMDQEYYDDSSDD